MIATGEQRRFANLLLEIGVVRHEDPNQRTRTYHSGLAMQDDAVDGCAVQNDIGLRQAAVNPKNKLQISRGHVRSTSDLGGLRELSWSRSDVGPSDSERHPLMAVATEPDTLLSRKT